MFASQVIQPSAEPAVNSQVRRLVKLSTVFIKDEDLYCLVFEDNRESSYRGLWVAPTEKVGSQEADIDAAVRAMEIRAGMRGKIIFGPYREIKNRRNNLIVINYFLAQPTEYIGTNERGRWFPEDAFSKNRGIAHYVRDVTREIQSLCMT
ncbi:MAG: hypothetical protein V1944_02040 [Candidatus Aenigmatarchaeota archaeon]